MRRVSTLNKINNKIRNKTIVDSKLQNIDDKKSQNRLLQKKKKLNYCFYYNDAKLQSIIFLSDRLDLYIVGTVGSQWSIRRYKPYVQWITEHFDKWLKKKR
jgi:hypothetical protein